MKLRKDYILNCLDCAHIFIGNIGGWLSVCLMSLMVYLPYYDGSDLDTFLVESSKSLSVWGYATAFGFLIQAIYYYLRGRDTLYLVLRFFKFVGTMLGVSIYQQTISLFVAGKFTNIYDALYYMVMASIGVYIIYHPLKRLFFNGK